MFSLNPKKYLIGFSTWIDKYLTIKIPKNILLLPKELEYNLVLIDLNPEDY